MLFKQVIALAKRVQTNTYIGKIANSVVRPLGEKIFGNFHNKMVVIVGE
jgi:glutamyl-tRNA reductase